MCEEMRCYLKAKTAWWGFTCFTAEMAMFRSQYISNYVFIAYHPHLSSQPFSYTYTGTSLTGSTTLSGLSPPSRRLSPYPPLCRRYHTIPYHTTPCHTIPYHPGDHLHTCLHAVGKRLVERKDPSHTSQTSYTMTYPCIYTTFAPITVTSTY